MVDIAPALRVVYFGTPDFAVPTLLRLIESRHPVCGVITQPDRPRGRGQRIQFGPVKALAVDRGLSIAQPERLRDPDAFETLRVWAPDLGVVAAYGQLIPEAMLALPRLGMINVHPSLLPLYRGAAPIQRAVVDGRAETGVTIMRVVKALDAGPMLAVARRAIGPNETSSDLERDLAALGAALLVDVVDRLAAGPVHEEPQDERFVTYASRLTKAEGAVDWRMSARRIHDHVRGLYPWPHAFAVLQGERIVLLDTTVTPESSAAPPGTVIAAEMDGICVATGDGRIVIHHLQAEGRRPMSARDFLLGRRLAPGTVFGHGEV